MTVGEEDEKGEGDETTVVEVVVVGEWWTARR